MTIQKQDSWSFLPFSKEFDRQDFDCGKEKLNAYLKKTLNQHHKSNISRATIATSARLGVKIAGYYTLNASRIDYASLPQASRKKLPERLDIPSIKVGMFAVDKRYAEQGLGEEMLMDALYKSYNMSAQLGLNNVIVDAIDDEAKAFWMKYDFIPFEDCDTSLFLPMATIAGIFEDKQ